MSYRKHHNASQRTVSDFYEDAVSCRFCECKDMRVSGRECETYLACPHCGADGPPGVGIAGAMEAYHGWPNRSGPNAPRIKR
jgi:hypothetical protein